MVSGHKPPFTPLAMQVHLSGHAGLSAVSVLEPSLLQLLLQSTNAAFVTAVMSASLVPHFQMQTLTQSSRLTCKDVHPFCWPSFRVAIRTLLLT